MIQFAKVFLSAYKSNLIKSFDYFINSTSVKLLELRVNDIPNTGWSKTIDRYLAKHGVSLHKVTAELSEEGEVMTGPVDSAERRSHSNLQTVDAMHYNFQNFRDTQRYPLEW